MRNIQLFPYVRRYLFLELIIFEQKEIRIINIGHLKEAFTPRENSMLTKKRSQKQGHERTHNFYLLF